MGREMNVGRNRAGYTLTELVFGVAILSVTMLGAGSLFVFFVDQMTVATERNAAEESLLFGSYYLKTLFSNAVGVSVFDTSTLVPGTPVVTPATQIASNYVASTDTVASVNTVDILSLYLRENGDNVSQFQSAGVFFQRPMDDSANKIFYPGRLFISLGPQGTPGTPIAAATLAPSLGDYISGHLVDISWQIFSNNSPPKTNDPAKAATITLTARYFLLGDNSQWRWCKSAAPGCTIIPPYKDLTATVEIGFRDNVLNISSISGAVNSANVPLPDRLFGTLYFFNYHLPRF